MDGLNNFGLTITTGNEGSERAWADLVRILHLSDSQAADVDVVAREITAQTPVAVRPVAALFESMKGPTDTLSARVSDLVLRLGVDGMRAIMQRLEVSDRKRAAHAAVEAISPAAMVPLLEAVGHTFSLPFSQPLLELVRKLSREASTLTNRSRVIADQSFRSLADELLERWSESQVNTGSSSFADMFGDNTRRTTSLAPEANRVVAMSLESGAIGTVVWASVKEQSHTEKGVRELISMLTRAPASRANEMITEQITTPARLVTLFREDPIDFDAVDMMVRHLGANATKSLLDELVEATNRSTRRVIMDKLVKVGPEIAPLVQERLNDPRWYVVRNMIALLRECGCAIDESILDRYASHEDARVRREMLQLRMETPSLRNAALATALRDKDKSVLRVALQQARSNLPPDAVSVLAQRVLSNDFPPEFRVMSLYLLGKSGHAASLDALLAYASGGKTLLGKVKLANASPEMLAALSGLARSWPTERRARELLDLAEKSKDSQIVNAVTGVAGGE